MNNETDLDQERAALQERLRFCAEKVGSGDELSRRTGIPRRTLANYLTGKNDPKSIALAQIARVAEVSADWLLGIDGLFAAKAEKPISNESVDPELLRIVISQLSAYLQREKLWRDIRPVEMSKVTLILYNLVKDKAEEGRKDLNFDEYAEIIKVILD